MGIQKDMTQASSSGAVQLVPLGAVVSAPTPPLADEMNPEAERWRRETARSRVRYAGMVGGLKRMSLLLLSVLFVASGLAAAAPQGKIAPQPLFRDPVHDGPTDPVLIWNRAEKKWFMMYTSRRANVPNLPGVSWVHGTAIGIAESADGGATWQYRGTADIHYGKPDYTFWAPDLIDDGKLYHMFLSVVPGIFNDWDAAREMVHLTSTDLRHWKFESVLPLASDRVIDASLCRLKNGTWRLWYKNERDNSHIYYADSRDLYRWTAGGVALSNRGQEGPKAFWWKDKYWMITDMWKGLAVYSSTDAVTWTAQADPILAAPGIQPTDRGLGHHADVVVSGDRAFIFYFTHQEGADANLNDPLWSRRSVIQVGELHVNNGMLICDRDQPTWISLAPK